MDLAEIVHYTAKLSADQIKTEVAGCSPEQITAITSLLSAEKSYDNTNKIRAVCLGLEERLQLEAFGKGIDASQALDIFNFFPEIDISHCWKLSPIIVGMNHDVFSDLLRFGNEQQLNILKQESVTEPVQHQLTLIGHAIYQQVNQICQLIDDFESEIETTSIEHIDHNLLERWNHTAERMKDQLIHQIHLIDKTLVIAWHTNRSDLIETLSSQKEMILRYISTVLGVFENEETPTTGIFQIIECRLKDVFGKPSEIESALDNEPSIEGLTKLSIWYLRDYWRIGLLPQVKDETMLRLDKSNHSEEECIEYRSNLFEQVQHNLKRIGLDSVRDLKEAGIYSKETLAHYIYRNSDKLTD